MQFLDPVGQVAGHRRRHVPAGFGLCQRYSGPPVGKLPEPVAQYRGDQRQRVRGREREVQGQGMITVRLGAVPGTGRKAEHITGFEYDFAVLVGIDLRHFPGRRANSADGRYSEPLRCRREMRCR